MTKNQNHGKAEARADDFSNFRDQLLNDALLGTAIVAVPGVALAVLRAVVIGWKPVMGLYFVLLGFLWGAWLLRARLSYRARVSTLLAVTLLVIYPGLAQFGPAMGGQSFVIVLAFTGMVFLNPRAAWSLVAANTAGLVLLGYAATQYWLPFDFDYGAYAHHPITWISLIWNMTSFGTILAYIVWRMVTELKTRQHVAERLLEQHRDTLAESRRLAQMQLDILEAIPDAVIVSDQTGTITLVNEQTIAMFGHRREDLIGAPVELLLPRGMRDNHVRHRQDYLAKPCVRSMGSGMELVATARDGREIPVDVGLGPIHSPDGILVVASLRDIRDRKEAQENLRRERDRAQHYLDTVQTIMLSMDKDGRITMINRHGCEILGYEADELLGRNWFELCVPQPMGVETIHPGFVSFIAGDAMSAKRIEYPVLCRDGRQILIAWNRTLLPAKDGHIAGVLSSGEDITERHLAEVAIRQAKEAAEEASRSKSLFLTSMSHELRTPLNAIIGFSQMLEMGVPGPLTSGQKDAVGHILGAGRHLLALISEVLDLARIEAGRMDLAIEVMPLVPLIDEVIALSQPIATARRIVVRQCCPQACHVRADRSRIRQILLNLLSNAVKYNREGGQVDVGFETLEGNIRITVTDTGHGIPEARRADIFQPFQRLGAEKTSVEGTGIGLVICRRLAEAMGGQIGFDSEVGVGSRFWFVLPLATAEEAAPSAALPAPQAVSTASGGSSKGKVLYVEDTPANVTVMRHAFRMLPGVELAIAPDGETALAMLADSAPDLVLMDINLPGISGREVLAKMKADRQWATIPVIAVSAAAMSADIESGIAAGFLAYFTKPLDLPVFLDQVREVLAARIGG